MTKFKKMMSVTLAGCMAASALMMSAGATRRDGKAMIRNFPLQQ